MKATIPTSLAVVFCTLFSYENISVSPSEQGEAHIIETSNEENELNKSGLDFTVYNSNINTKYSEFSSATFRNKLIIVSSKKIGGLGNGLDSHANEPITDSKVLLLDEVCNELSTQTTGIDAHFSFSIKAFEKYQLKILKPGFESNEFVFEANNTKSNIYKQVLKLSAKNRPSSNKE